ncbi:MAG: hypothetical protein M3Z20_12170 [Chloroflexota bacterium]|nr:hypothetical protein [Chloroflexota bacterium]
MQRNTAILLSITLLACAAAIYFWQQLQMERKRTRQLSTVAAQVEGRKQAASVAPQLSTFTEGKQASIAAPKKEDVSKEDATTSVSQIKQFHQTFPDLQEETGFSAEEIEVLAELHAKRAWESEYEARLGAVKNQRLNDYWNSFYAKARIADLRRALQDTRHPLREDQVPLLYSIISTESERERYERRASAYLTSDQDRRTQLDLQLLAGKLRQESNARVLTSASPYLEQEQRAVLAAQLSSGMEEQLQLLEKESSELK